MGTLRAIARVASLATAVLATGGCYRNNLPNSDGFGALPPVTTARVSVDANGTFYPDRWKQAFGYRDVRKRHALESVAKAGDPRRERLAAEADRQLAEIAAQMAGKSRIFILVHGFNSHEWEAAFPYDRIIARLQPRAEDMVIRFHWDGLVQTTQGGQLGSWFKAVGYSQMAGMRALRRILNLARRQDIFLISHSRGASVVLSALSTPPFDPDFQKDTESITGAFAALPALAANGNRIRAIMLAPAIGRADFWAPSCSGQKDCATLRDLTPQLISIRYTVNANDLVLKKVFPQLSSRFNATNFGYSDAVGQSLMRTYGCLHPIRIESRDHGHAFIDYVEDEEFMAMVSASKADVAPCRYTP